LTFHEPKLVDGVCVVKPPDEVFELGVKEWSNALVGYFVGKRIPFKIIKENLEKKWRKWGAVSVIIGDNGTFLFKFDNSAARDLVLSNGPWEVWGAYLALRRWEEGMSLSKDSFSSIPVWFKLANVPSELWTKSGLSYVASALGVPLCMDATTTAGNRLSFARVCIEMKASSNFPTSYKVRRRNGTLVEVMVQYAWKPSPCSVCKVFEHSSKQCHLVARKDVVVKQGGERAQGLPAMDGGSAPVGEGAFVSKFQDTETAAILCVEGFPTLKVVDASLGETVEGYGRQDGGPELPVKVPHEASEPPSSPVQDRCNLQVGKGKDPITPYKNAPEAAILSLDTASLDPNIMILNFIGSGKRRKKKGDAKGSPLHPMISCASWNIIGLNHPLKQEVSRFILMNKVAICGLFESRTAVENVQKIAQRMCKKWDWATNHAFSPLGRIWVMWDPSIINFEVSLMTDQAIHGKAVLGNGAVVRLSFVYGLCDYRSRRDLWKYLIYNSHIASSVPWLILGDFNVSRFPQDQLNGPPRFSKAMSEFNECLKLIEVDDIHSVGHFFTWSNKRAGNFAVNKKLDRVLANWHWHNLFSYSMAHFHNPGVSNHSLVTVFLMDRRTLGNKPFKFLNFWAKDARFTGLVNRVCKQRAVGNLLEAVLCKLRNLKRELK
ncbi:LOW QUALITY PROTEIN: Exo_endo_phos domain-containing protein/DUF4283 domain-containing protein, partial [Cephalotus follicularis]